MLQGQFEPISQSYGGQIHPLITRHGRHRLLQKHPVLLPAFLIFGSVVFCIASFYTDTLFPLLALFNVPTSLLCLSVALVLGVSGIVASIISILERLDRSTLPTTTFPKPKEAL